MEINWKDIELADQEIIQDYYRKEQSRSCEFTFGNNILWAPYFRLRYAIVKGALVFLAGEQEFAVSFPMGGAHVKEALDVLLAYFDEKGWPFRMYSVTPQQFEVLEELFPGGFAIAYDRDAADYIYESEKLISLSGKKLHSKRNHINKFLSEHEDWGFEFITEQNLPECVEMVQNWREMNDCDANPKKQNELCVTLLAFEKLEELGLTGGLIRMGGRVIAVSVGEPCCDDTFVVHIEKAYADIPGAYPIINQQFVKHAAAGYRYINREDDGGEEGLRKAKLSYHPAFMQEKGMVTRRAQG